MATRKPSTKTAAKKTKAKTENETKNPEKSSRSKIAIFLVALVVIGCIALVMNAGNLAKSAVERVAGDTLGVKVTIATLDISLQNKEVTVTGLKIGNPEGYEKPHAMTVETIRIAAEDLKKDLLTFSEITVDGTAVHLAVSPDNTNLTRLRNQAASEASADKAQPDRTAQPKVIINKLNITSASLHPETTLVTRELQPVTLPTIRLTGIGERTNGVLASEAIAQILEYVTQVAMRHSVEAGYLQGMTADSLKTIQEDLGLSSGLMDQMRDLGDKVKDIFGN